jgi:hypothetical protein
MLADGCFYSSVQLEVDLKFIVSLSDSDGEVHVEASKDIVRVGLAVDKSPALVLAL